MPSSSDKLRAAPKNYLAIDGYIKGDKFSPIKKIEVSCPDLKAEQQPLFKQKGKPWPK